MITQRTTEARSAPAHPLQELLRAVASTRQAQEVERKRRAAWEQEQEAKFDQMRTDFELKIRTLQEELRALKNTAPSLPTPSASVTPQGLPPQHDMLFVSQHLSPISPISQPSM